MSSSMLTGEFLLKVTLGNDAMSSVADIAHALRAVAYHLERGRTSNVVMDHNGNSVGEWSLNIIKGEEENEEAGEENEEAGEA